MTYIYKSKERNSGKYQSLIEIDDLTLNFIPLILETFGAYNTYIYKIRKVILLPLTLDYINSQFKF